LAQAAENPPSIHEALSSNPSTPEKKKKYKLAKTGTRKKEIFTCIKPCDQLQNYNIKVPNRNSVGNSTGNHPQSPHATNQVKFIFSSRMKTPEFVLWQHGRDGRTVD
jgi:hypothetical protein